VLVVDPHGRSVEELAPAVAWLRRGGVVAFPTDTFYGLAADPQSAAAIAALFALKGRDVRQAVPFVAASRAQVDAWCGLSDASAHLATAFWPGPLSLICAAPDSVVAEARAGGDTVAVRVPDHPIARALAYAWGSPLPATSANRSGEPPAQRVEELTSLANPTLLVVDAGPTPGGAASTIVDARGDAPVLVREGAIAWERVLHSLKA
jgi:L-threonylcarbamoyladenylate synthase